MSPCIIIISNVLTYTRPCTHSATHTYLCLIPHHHLNLGLYTHTPFLTPNHTHTLSSMSPLPNTISALAFMKDSWPSCMCWKMSSASSLSGYCTEIRSLKKLKTDCLNLSSTLSRTRFVWGSHSSYSHLYETMRFGCNKWVNARRHHGTDIRTW